MFRKNDQHLQWPLFSSIDSLPKKHQARLEASWAGTFYHELFCRIDEEPFAVLYSDDEASRPNIPINLLVGALGREDGGHQQFERVPVRQLGLDMRVPGPQYFSYVVRPPARAHGLLPSAAPSSACGAVNTGGRRIGCRP